MTLQDLADETANHWHQTDYPEKALCLSLAHEALRCAQAFERDEPPDWAALTAAEKALNGLL